MSSFGKEDAVKKIIGTLNTQDNLAVVMAVKRFLDTLMDSQQPIGEIHLGAIPALQKLLTKAMRTHGELSDEYLMVFKAIRATYSGREELSADNFRMLIKRYAMLLSLFNSSRITRESMNIDSAAELHIFVSALVEAGGGPKALSSSL